MLSVLISALTSRAAKMSGLLLLALTFGVGAAAACGGDDQLGPGDGANGRLLTVIVNEVRRTQDIRYSTGLFAQPTTVDDLLITVTNVQAGESIPYTIGDGETQYVISPSRSGRQITIMFGSIRNQGESPRTVSLDGASLGLKTQASPEVYPLLDVTPSNPVNVKASTQDLPENQVFRLYPGGEITLDPGTTLSRWLTFETPSGAAMDALSWQIEGQQSSVNFVAEHYHVFPSSPDNELVAINLQVYNREANTVAMEIAGDTVELRGFGIDEAYPLLDVTSNNTANVATTPGSHPDENRFTPFVRGVVSNLPLGNSLSGWIIFDVPKGAGLRELKWDAGDTVFIRPN